SFDIPHRQHGRDARVTNEHRDKVPCWQWVPCPTLAWACLWGAVRRPCPTRHVHASVEHGTRPVAVSDSLTPSPGTPGEGWPAVSAVERGEDLEQHHARNPHPNPLPEYQERGPEPLRRQGD